MARQSLKVMLVEDHEVVREGLQMVLERTGDIAVVAVATTARNAVATAARARPNVIVMDVRLLEGNGIQATREIRSRLPRTGILMLASFQHDEALFASIMAGAAGHLLKRVRSQELIQAIRAVAAGQSLLDPAVTERVLEYVRGGSKGGRPQKLAHLTPREKQILSLVAVGKTNAQIGIDVHLPEETVKNHVSTILEKLEVARRTEATAHLVRHSAVGLAEGR
jgi:two-component system response regulator DevR